MLFNFSFCSFVSFSFCFNSTSRFCCDSSFCGPSVFCWSVFCVCCSAALVALMFDNREDTSNKGFLPSPSALTCVSTGGLGVGRSGFSVLISGFTSAWMLSPFSSDVFFSSCRCLLLLSLSLSSLLDRCLSLSFEERWLLDEECFLSLLEDDER